MVHDVVSRLMVTSFLSRRSVVDDPPSAVHVAISGWKTTAHWFVSFEFCLTPLRLGCRTHS